MNKKFSELESAGTLTGGELLAVSQKDSNDSLQSRKLTAGTLKWYLGPGFTETVTYSSGFDSSFTFSGGSYWRSGILLDDASHVSPVNVGLTKVPCDADGNPLMYTLNVYFSDKTMDRAVSVLLTVSGEIKQFRDVETNELKPGTWPVYTLTYWK